jgi:pimeloyl-ACP methyl ester carboxylesterase
MPRKLILPVLLFLLVIRGFSQGNFIDDPGRGLPVPFENSHFKTIDSIRFHYRTWNDGLPAPKGKVLLVHGFIGSTFCWRENTGPLADAGYEVVSVDLPGFGYSDRNLNANQSQSNRARFLWDLMTAIDGSDTSKWNIVGHSMGGGTVEAMALMKPERIKSLTIVDGMVFLRNKDVNGSFVVMTRMKETNRVLVALTKKEVIGFDKIQGLLKGLYGYAPDSAVVEGYLNPLLIKGSAECILNVFANAREIQHFNSDSLGKLPILVVWGKKDHTIRYISAKQFINAFPSIELKVIPDACHSPMETHPGVFNNYLLEFLEKYN